MAASKQKKDDPFVVTFEERGDQTIVRKSNDLVQMTRNNLTLSQQRLMLHIFSMIKPEDTDLPSYELSIYDFIKMTGMDPHSGALYKQVRKNIEELANAPIQWIKNNGTSTVETFRWIDKVRIDEGRARMTITLDPVLKPHLVQLKTLYTTMDVTYTMLMRSTYSIRIYELCKSYQSLYLKKKAAGEPLVWNLSMLYEQLSYTANRWSDFRRLALEKAKAEINEKTDIIFNYDVYEKKGQKVLSLVVTIDPVDDAAAQANLDSINSTVRKKSKKKGRPTVAIEDSLLDDPSVITFDYVSAPETTIPYSFGRHRTELREEIVVKARMDQLRAEITPEELHAVEVIIDVLADACCTIQAGDGEQDGGNKTVFGKMNAIILDCGGLTSWLAGVAPRYAQEIIPRSQTMRSPARYLNKVLREDMDNYRIYIFRKAKLADGAIDNNYPLIADNTSYSNYLHLMTSEQIGMNTLLGYSQVWTRLSDPGGTLASDIMLGYRYYVASKAGSWGKDTAEDFLWPLAETEKFTLWENASGTGHFLSQRRTMKRMQPRKRTRRMCLRTRTGCRSCSFTQLPSTGKKRPMWMMRPERNYRTGFTQTESRPYISMERICSRQKLR